MAKLRSGWEGSCYPENLDDRVAIEKPCWDPTDAAEELADQQWNRWNLWEAGEEFELGVRSPEGEFFKVTVYVGVQPTFSATDPEPVDPPEGA